MGWGPEAEIKGSVSKEARQLAGMDHSLKMLEKQRNAPV